MLACDCPNCLEKYDTTTDVHFFNGFRFRASHCPGILNGHSCDKLDEHPRFPIPQQAPCLPRAKLLTLRANAR